MSWRSSGSATRRRIAHASALAAWSALVVVGAACGNGSSSPPTSPTDGSEVLSLAVSCQASFIIGEQRPCIAVARLRSGGMPLVSFAAAWTSAQPGVATVDARGLVTGRGAGQSVVTATYQGRSDQATVSVTAEDALKISSAADQGEFRPGTTVTMYLLGFYSVDSADTGRLSLRINDQNGAITRTPPMTVAKGGDAFVLSATFVVPQASTQVCRAAVLEVGAVSISAPDPSSSFACVPIRQ